MIYKRLSGQTKDTSLTVHICSDFSYYENGLVGPSETCASEYLPTPKRHHPHSGGSHMLLQHGGGLLFSPGAGGGGAVTSSHPHVPPPPHLHPAADYPQQYGYAPYPGTAHCNPRDSTADLLADRRHGDEEWKNIYVVSCTGVGAYGRGGNTTRLTGVLINT